MLRSYLMLALRALRRRRAYAVINTVGLTVGLACCALVVLFIEHEMAYDRHHDDADRIYRLTQVYRSSTYSTISFEGYQNASGSEQDELAEALVRDVAAIEQATNFEILQRSAYVEVEDHTFETDRYLMTTSGPEFLDLFTFDGVAGAGKDALHAPYTAVLTKPVAERYFGPTSPIGQTITLDPLTLTVTGVVAEPPSNSRITFDIAAHVKRIPNWGAYHYVRLAPGADPEAVEPQIAAVKDRVDPRRVNDPYTRSNLKSDDLQALTDIHLGPRLLYDDTAHRDVRYLWAFGAIGLLILSISPRPRDGRRNLKDVEVLPDGRTAFFTGVNGRITKVDLVTGARLDSMQVHPGFVSEMQQAPGGRLLAVNDLDGATTLIDPDTLAIVQRFEQEASFSSRRLLFALAFRPGTSQILTGGIRLPLILWDIDTGERVRTISTEDVVIHPVSE